MSKERKKPEQIDRVDFFNNDLRLNLLGGYDNDTVI